MRMPQSSTPCWLLFAFVQVHFAVISHAQTPELPKIKFFYFSEPESEWAEPDTLQHHLANNSDSNTLFESLQHAASGNADPELVRQQMGQWIEKQRKQFEQSGGNKVLYRKLEGVLAYLRAHDFEIPKLVSALKNRSGASDVQLVGVHLVDSTQQSSFKLKVVLRNPAIDIGRQGFNIDTRSPEVSELTTVFALGVALYEVHEILNDNDAARDGSELEESDLEPIPTPALPFGPPLEADPTTAAT